MWTNDFVTEELQYLGIIKKCAGSTDFLGSISATQQGFQPSVKIDLFNFSQHNKLSLILATHLWLQNKKYQKISEWALYSETVTLTSLLFAFSLHLFQTKSFIYF